MAEQIANLYCLLYWYDQERNWSIQNCSTIMKPRRDPHEYKEGELVLGKFQGQTFRTAIVRIKDNKDLLKGDMLQLEGLLKDSTLSPNQVMEKMGLSVMESMDHDIDQGKESSGPQQKPETISKPSKTKKRPSTLTNMDEAKQVKKDALTVKTASVKRKKECAIAVSQDLLNERIDVPAQLDQLVAAVRCVEQRQNELLHKFNILMDTMQCRDCIKSMYKEAKKSTCKLQSPENMLCSPPPCHKPKTLHFDVEGTNHSTTTDNAEVPKEASTRLDFGEMTSVSSDKENVDDLVSLGDAQFGIMMKRDELGKCIQHSSNANKLALNLLEYLVTAEECANMTVYGKGKEKVSMKPQLRRALRSQVFSLYNRDATEDEKNIIWNQMVYKMNDKIRGLKNKKNLFSRKQKDSLSLQSAPGWKLFGRVPPKDVSLHKDPVQISLEYQAKQRSSQHASAKTKRPDLDILSTTALILENRPMNLPSKPPDEEQKHRLEYESMVEGAKRKEQQEARKRKKKVQLQIRHEEKLMASAKLWNTEILPNWETAHVSKKSQELWWKGIPPCVRGRVWKLALGNELNLTHDLYDICASRANDRLRLLNDGDTASISSTSTEPPSCKESSMELIQLDISRTFPQLCIFQKGGPYYDLIHCLLSAYCCYRPDVGYVQGMSFLAAVLLLNMDVADAFVCFSNLLNRPCTVAFFRVDEGLMKSYFQTYEEFFKENLPVLYTHFQKQNLTPDLYITDWMFTLFSKSVPLDVACRVWDMFCRDGEEFLFRVAIGILRMYLDILIHLDFIHLAQFLTKLPEDINSDVLFQHINAIKMNIDKKRFAQVLASHREVKVT